MQHPFSHCDLKLCFERRDFMYRMSWLCKIHFLIATWKFTLNCLKEVILFTGLIECAPSIFSPRPEIVLSTRRFYVKDQSSVQHPISHPYMKVCFERIDSQHGINWLCNIHFFTATWNFALNEEISCIGWVEFATSNFSSRSESLLWTRRFYTWMWLIVQNPFSLRDLKLCFERR